MDYKIGNVAKLLGISSQAIRYYESRGVVNPEKTESNNYRKFSTWDLDILIRTRVLRSYGYSISEVTDILNNEDILEVKASFKDQEKKIKEIIDLNLNLLTRIQEEDRNIVDTLNLDGEYIIQQRPGMYRLENPTAIDENEKFRNLIKKWIDMAPFVYGSIRIEKQEYETEREKFNFGQVIDEEYKNYFNIKENEYISYLPPTKCIYTIIKFNSKDGFSPELMTNAMEYIQSQGLELKGDIITRISLLNIDEDQYNCYHQVWLPI